MKYIRPVSANSATGLVADVYDQIKKEFGSLVEPFTLHSLIPNLLAGAWMAARESELAGNVRRDVKEAVAATVSRINQCPYCVDAHSIMLRAAGKHKTAKAIINGKINEISDPKIRSVVRWASASRSPGTEPLLSPPFNKEEAPEIIGTAVFYHYINRMVSVLLSETPLPSNRSWLRKPLERFAGLLFSRAVRRSLVVGESLRFLPEADLPTDLGWSRHVSTVAKAFSRFAVTVESSGKQALPLEVRKLICERVQTWEGEDPGLSRSWVEKSIRGLDEKAKVAGRLALLTAFSPYQVDGEIVLDFQLHFPDAKELLGALAWSSLIVARKIGVWLQSPFSKR